MPRSSVRGTRKAGAAAAEGSVKEVEGSSTQSESMVARKGRGEKKETG